MRGACCLLHTPTIAAYHYSHAAVLPSRPSLPPAETKGIPLDTAYTALFARHRIWKRVMGRKGEKVLEREAFRAAAWRQAQGAEGGDLRGLAKYYETLGL